MKKRIAMLGSVMILIAQGIIYPQSFVVTKVNYETNTFDLETYTGHVWEERDPEDWAEGDLASAIMFNGFTEDDITDDVVLCLRYVGRANWQ